ncbi:MAG TPA: phage integrase SAM-like domain-containing protein [Bacteroidales bacterium]|nr:phage integrase SAM-like domain-containing protein [Bacteroidales bacterium]
MAKIKPQFKLKSSKPVDVATLIYLIIYYNNKRFKCSTGEKIEPRYWDSVSQRAMMGTGEKTRDQDHADINFQLNKHHNQAIIIFDRFEREGKIPSLKTVKQELDKGLYVEEKKEPKGRISLNKYIDQFIKDIEKGKRLTDKGLKYSHGTIKNYKGFQTQFDEFQQETHRKYNFEDITIDFYDQYVQFFNKKNYSLNTIGRHIKNLKTIMKFSKEEGLHTNLEPERKKFKILKTDTDQIYLTEDELTRMYDLDLREDKEKELARDVFMIGCYTALRFSDYSRIQKDHVRTTAQGNRVICKSSAKSLPVKI